MPRNLPEDYFSQGVFKGARPGEFFKAYTCTQCGHRSASWARFTAHRRGCPGDMARMGARLPALDADQAALLADLLRQVDADAA